MTVKYLVRMDDACPSMRREIWDPLEAALDSLGIRPIVGVIPDNRDPSMLCSEPDPDFWERVRGWDKKGWGIALHGLHHTYHTIPDHGRSLIAIHQKSEFVGLSLEEQTEIINKSWHIFLENGVKPTVFMAPSHTFDENTLLALRAKTDVRIVTDGHALFPFRDNDFTWIPQQLWRFRKMPLGIWTVCLHPNDMSVTELNTLIEQLAIFADKTVPLDLAITHCSERKTFIDRIFAFVFGIALEAKQRMSR
jgi:predicted deacetylase